MLTNMSHSTRVRGLKCLKDKVVDTVIDVALYTSAWIEMFKDWRNQTNEFVALYTSAWIEINRSRRYLGFYLVALYTSAWIEMTVDVGIFFPQPVALYTSAWIEMYHLGYFCRKARTSHSTRVRGLKYLCLRKLN